jgi:hypothetical protein
MNDSVADPKKAPSPRKCDPTPWSRPTSPGKRPRYRAKVARRPGRPSRDQCVRGVSGVYPGRDQCVRVATSVSGVCPGCPGCPGCVRGVRGVSRSRPVCPGKLPRYREKVARRPGHPSRDQCVRVNGPVTGKKWPGALVTQVATNVSG